MLRRRLAVLLTLLVAVAGISGALYAQLETADRGILPLDSSGTLEIGGIHVDVGAKDSMTARYAGWRIAQREGFRALWAKMHSAPLSQAPNLPDSTLDDIVSSISVEREQIGPNRYIADLGVLFDRVRAAPFLGVEGGEVRRSNPMLLIPVMISGGTETSVELKNSWQRAWAQFRTSQSPIDYVRVSGLGADPMLINAAQADRRGRSWWRNLIDIYGAADILVAEVQVQRLYPGGPARGRFIGRHGPDGEIVDGFTLMAPNGDVPGMMAEGVKRMDDLFQAALAAGKLTRDSSLNQPAPPPLPVEEPVETAPTSTASSVQVQISAAGDVNIYNFAMAHLRTLGGIQSATPQMINPTGVSYVLVTYNGTLGELAAKLGGRGWIVTTTGGNVLTMRSSSGKPPPLPPPPQPATPPQPQPAATPPGRQE
jgi:hypothetical protein